MFFRNAHLPGKETGGAVKGPLCIQQYLAAPQSPVVVSQPSFGVRANIGHSRDLATIAIPHLHKLRGVARN
jgi:hypothetical protein